MWVQVSVKRFELKIQADTAVQYCGSAALSEVQSFGCDAKLKPPLLSQVDVKDPMALF